MTFDATITAGHIVQGLLIVCGILASYFALDKRIALVQKELRYVWRELEKLPCTNVKGCEREKGDRDAH